MIHDITAAQFRAARAFLGWSLVDLAKVAGVSVSGVANLEGRAPASDVTREAVENAFASAGIRFLPDEGDGFGLRFQAPTGDHRDRERHAAGRRFR